MHARILALAAVLCGCWPGRLPAQVPAHAVRLDPTVSQRDPAIARDGDTVHAVGITTNPAPGFVHHARSRDGGRTWPIVEQPIAYARGLCALAVDGDHVHAVVDSGTNGPWVVSSHDAGTHWFLPARVSQQSTAPQLETCRLRAYGSTVLVVWTESRAGGRVWANRSLDGGLTWQATDTRLDVGLLLPNGSSDFGLRLLGEGSELHCVWSHVGTSTAAAYQRSLDGGATWLPAARILSPSSVRTAAGSTGAFGALLVADDAGTLLRSVDQGTTWAAVTGHGIGSWRDVAIDGAEVLAVGVDAASVMNVRLNASADGGLTWLPVPYSILSLRGFVATARVAGTARFVHFAFPYDQVAPTGVVIQSDDRGVLWRAVAGEAGHGLLAGEDGGVVLAKSGWNGADVQAWVLEGHTLLGHGTAGTGGIVPRLAGAGLAGLGRTFSLRIEGARGGATGAVYATWDAAANVPVGAATLYLQQPIGPFVFTTVGTMGAPGQGSASLPMAVPFDTSFAGLRLLSQAFVLDAAAADGFAATHAVETWLR